jgi:hypothetical protein
VQAQAPPLNSVGAVEVIWAKLPASVYDRPSSLTHGRRVLHPEDDQAAIGIAANRHA